MAGFQKKAVAVRHVHFEDVGTFAASLEEAQFELEYLDLASVFPDPLAADLVIVLGGPIGTYEVDRYPLLREEIGFIRTRLHSNKPTLGLCLGAQLMAAALGARVAPAGYKEIGFAPVDLTVAGKAGPLRHIEGVPVLHAIRHVRVEPAYQEYHVDGPPLHVTSREPCESDIAGASLRLS